MTIAQMRALLGLGSDISDAAVVDAYVAYLLGAPAPTPTVPAAIDPFAMGMAALMRGPRSAEVVYTPPGGGTPTSLRAVRTTTTADLEMGNRSVIAGSTLIECARADLSAPAKGGVFAFAAGNWEITADPRLDDEAVSWTCEAAPPIG